MACGSRAVVGRDLRLALGVLALGSLLGVLLAAAAVRAATDDEARVKAAYVYKFLRYVKWPETDPLANPLVIAVDANEGLLDALRRLDGLVIDDRPISVRRLTDLQDADECAVVVFGRGAQQAESVLSKLAGTGRPVLTIGDDDSEQRAATMITFLRVGRNVAFTVDLTLASAAGIRFSAHLLQNAEVVHEAKEGD